MNSGQTVQELTSDCGHHCGVKDRITGHCSCVECHGQPTGPIVSTKVASS